MKILSFKSLFLLLSIIVMVSCSPQPEPLYRIGFSQCTTGDSWRKNMLEGMKRELSFYPEIAFEMKDAEGKTDKQNQDIQQFIDEKVDLLIVSPNENKAHTDVIEKAYNAGIPVIILDRRTTSKKYTAFVGAENYLVGQNAGEYANILLKGKGNVLDITEGANTSPNIDRNAGFVDAIKKYPDIDFSESLLMSGLDSISIEKYFVEHPSLNLVFAHNDRIALSVYKVCKSLGLSKKIKIIGVDGLAGTNEGLDMVNKGMIDATILYPTGGEESIQTAVKILKKLPYNKENQLFTTVITPDNVRIMLSQFQKVKVQQQDIERQALKITQLNDTYSSQRNRLYFISALLLVVIVLGGFLWFLLTEKQKSNRVLEEQNLAIIKQNEEIERVSLQARQAVEDKMRFYSYISHEFKTPLSLILTPTEDLLNRKSYDSKEGKPILALILKNANRLLRLVDQILDFRKIDSGKIVLNSETYDLVSFTKEIVNDFAIKAKKSNIDLQFICPFKELPYTFDAEKLDKVFFNLISNAFKYTPNDGLIHITLLRSIQNIEITVSDNGVGMDKKDKDNAFELFYRATQNVSFGTGLGLALSREFVGLHDGDISVESEKGKGTTFKIVLPYLENNTTLQKQPIPLVNHTIENDTILLNGDLNYGKNNKNESETSIVIVEDNLDLLQFLSNKFSQFYQVRTSETAEKGWEIILNTIPDVIISDVTLPGRDGFSLTKQIKEDFRTSHIPVILLTAKGKLESQIEGEKAGADAYMGKPFNQQLLEEKVKNLLDNRDRIRRRFSNEITNLSHVQSNERKFLIDFELLIEKYMKENTLSVEHLSKEMGMSRVQLYRKITALTNKNVNDYIAEFKVKKAKQLLQDPTKNITEIAYELGFNNPGYFTTFFKQKTNQTPSDWRNV
jgi:signal transduction histidine kinase/DNA-binding response OmpR family regulator